MCNVLRFFQTRCKKKTKVHYTYFQETYFALNSDGTQHIFSHKSN
jgi:hypothetical protein